MGLAEGRYMNIAQGFAYSSNIGMTKLEQKMGNNVWMNYLHRFKFGLPTRLAWAMRVWKPSGDNYVIKLCLPLDKGFPSVKLKCYGPLVPSLMMDKCWSRSL